MPAAIDDTTELKPYDYEDCEEIPYCEENDNCEKEEPSLASLFYGDFYVIGKMWVGLLRTILVGAKLTLLPSVQAATVHAASVKEPCPAKVCKPPKMKYTDLPLYETPHKTYNDHIKEKDGCPQQNKKIVQMILQPHVKTVRQRVQKTACAVKCAIVKEWKELSCEVKKSKKNAHSYLTDPKNEDVRKGIVATAAGLGYYMGSGGRGLSKKLFWSGFGAATAGMLCFPKETDMIIRNACFYTGQGLLTAYNVMLKKNIELPGKVPCRSDLPAEPKEKRKIVPCVPRKEK